MARVAGIIHPQVQISELIPSFSLAFGEPSSRFAHKNLELASWGESLVTDPSKTLKLLFNGSLENEFKGKAPETILDGYAKEGEHFFTKLEGEFVFALFDEVKEQLFIARDRIGRKLLYWTLAGNTFLFSSELKGLLATGVVPQTPSNAGFASYLAYGYIPQDYSPIKGVNKLLPGHFLKIDLSKKLTIHPFSSYSQLLSKKKDHNGSEEKFLELLERSLESIETKKVASLSEGHLFNGYPTLEKSGACSDILHDLVKIVWQLDEPLAAIEVVETYCAAKRAEKSGVQTVISPVGFDELACGKSRYFEDRTFKPSFLYKLANGPKLLRNIALETSDFFNLNLKWKILRNTDLDLTHLAYLSKISLFNHSERKRVSPKLFPYFDPEIFLERFHRLKKVMPFSESLAYLDVKTDLPDSSILQLDHLFSAHDIAVKTPFLESPFVHFFTSLDEQTKKNLGEKFLPKVAGVVTENWIENREIRALFSLLRKGALVDEGFISLKWIRHELGFPYLIERNFRQFWALLILEIWFHLFIRLPIRPTNVDIPLRELMVL